MHQTIHNWVDTFTRIRESHEKDEKIKYYLWLKSWRIEAENMWRFYDVDEGGFFEWYCVIYSYVGMNKLWKLSKKSGTNTW